MFCDAFLLFSVDSQEGAQLNEPAVIYFVSRQRIELLVIFTECMQIALADRLNVGRIILPVLSSIRDFVCDHHGSV